MRKPRNRQSRDDASHSSHPHLDKLAEIFSGEQCGEIEGVYLDFRHELLPPGEWLAPQIGESAAITDSASDMPRLWYPWFGELRVDNGWPWNPGFKKTPDEMLAWPVETRPRDFGGVAAEYVLQAGDKLVVDKVVRDQIGDKFEHLHDSEIRLAYLKVVRTIGEAIKLPTPVVFKGNQSILAISDFNDCYEEIVSRVLSHFRLKSLREIVRIKDDGTYAYKALKQANELADLQKRDAKKQAVRTSYYVASAALLGYLWAKAETEIHIKPLALKALKIEGNNKRGGELSGAARLKLAKDGWMKIARRLAFDIRAHQPTLSQERLAKAMEAKWANGKPVLPERPSVVKFIARLEKHEGLPPKLRKGRLAISLAAE